MIIFLKFLILKLTLTLSHVQVCHYSNKFTVFMIYIRTRLYIVLHLIYDKYICPLENVEDWFVFAIQNPLNMGVKMLKLCQIVFIQMDMLRHVINFEEQIQLVYIIVNYCIFSSANVKIVLSIHPLHCRQYPPLLLLYVNLKTKPHKVKL